MARTNRNPHSRTNKRTRPNLKYHIVCARCHHKWDMGTSRTNVRCPNCKAWCRVHLTPDLTRYIRGLGVTPSGNETLDIADATADLLRGLAIDDLYAVVADHLEKCGIESMSKGFRKLYGKDTPWDIDTIQAFLSDRYADRNPGMQRMNLGNLLRSAQQRRSALNIESK